MNTEVEIHRARSWIATIITFIILIIIGAFVWRIFFYSHLIQSGQMSLADLNFSKNVSTISRFASQPVSDQAVDVTTKDNPSLGNPKALVTIVEFADFQCPYSREASFTMRALAAQYPDKFRFIYRNFPITEIHPLAQPAAEAAMCANDQGKFWEYHDKLFQNQNEIQDASFGVFATAINLDTIKFSDCFSSGKYKEKVAKDYQDGFDAGVRGTPTFFINGNRVPGAIPKDVLEKVILNLSQPGQTK